MARQRLNIPATGEIVAEKVELHQKTSQFSLIQVPGVFCAKSMAGRINFGLFHVEKGGAVATYGQ